MDEKETVSAPEQSGAGEGTEAEVLKEQPAAEETSEAATGEAKAAPAPKKAGKGKKESAPAKKKTGFALVMRDLTALLIKLVLILLVVVIGFTFLFGAYRNADPGMVPSVKDGDLVFYYRLDKFYHSGDVLVAKYNDRMITLRVVAVAGDVVDINENGLYINGSLQYEQNTYEKTYRFEEGVDFPLTVGEGEVFVLGDAREHAADSRVFGPIKISDTYGKVMAIFRRRSI